jgi:hypothetical protein
MIILLKCLEWMYEHCLYKHNFSDGRLIFINLNWYFGELIFDGNIKYSEGH